MPAGMTIEWQPLPPADGAPYPCSVYEPKKKWPYTGKCQRTPVRSMMPNENYKDEDLKKEFNLSGRIVCDFHRQYIDAYLADRDWTEDNG